MATRSLFEAFHRAGKELFLVGGAVRDLAMGAKERDLDDLDFTTNARPAESLKILRQGGFRTYDMGFEFGTVGAVLDGPASEGFPKDVQVTTYRSSEYYRRGSRHPVVKFGDTLDQDLGRRDFSINSIAMDLDGGFVDPYGGLQDIADKRLRVVGDPHETLAEDPLRILRVGRFMAKLGFSPTPTLREACYDNATHILDISRERWHQEMNKLLVAPFAKDALRFLADVRILNLILPELVALIGLHERSPVGGAGEVDLWEETLALVEAVGEDRVLSWVALMAHTGRPWTRSVDGQRPPGPSLAGLGSPSAFGAAGEGELSFDRHPIMAAELCRNLSRRFHFDNATAGAVEFVILHQRVAFSYSPSTDDADIRRFYRDMKGHHGEVIGIGEALRRVGCSDAGAGLEELAELRGRIEALEAADELVPRLPRGLGNVLMAELGIGRGPLVGDLMDWLTEEIISGHLASGLDPEAYVRYLVDEQPEVLAQAQQTAGPSRRGGPKR